MLRSAWDYCVNRKNPETRTQNPETGNWKRETGIKPVIGNQFSVLSSARRLFMSLPVIAITNASTCLTDLQVLTAIPALQRQILWISELIGTWIAGWCSGTRSRHPRTDGGRFP
jgi:hypothetical protein